MPDSSRNHQPASGCSNMVEQRSPSSQSSSSSTSPMAKRAAAQRRASWKRQFRYIYVRFIRMQGSSRAIARGLAAGVFAGWFPLFGLQTIIGIAIAAIIQGNKIMAAAGTWVSNPFTYVPIYYFNFRVGQWMLGQVGVQSELPSLDTLQTIISASGQKAASEFIGLGFNFIFTLFFGCFIIGIPSAVLAYGLGLWITQKIRQRRRRSAEAQGISQR